jgi:putative protease
MSSVAVPELLAPAGSLDAARAALANGADAIYLGADRFNARDEGAHLGLDDLEEACRLARERGKRVYLTLNTLLKPSELAEALLLLGECIDRGIDAAIVQDIGLVRLIQRVYPGFELHGSTQMTVHDESGAAVMHELGLQRVVLARENTLEDIRCIRSAVPELRLETFIHGALCISYSGQCYMSGMISERSANRGSCAQSCRKGYTLTDTATSETLDSGYRISARDLAAYDHLRELAELGVHTLKIEGRKKKPEYVATVTRSYREFLEHVRAGEPAVATPETPVELVQIFSRGFTGGMYGGRAGRDYVTRDQPDNRGVPLGTVVGRERGGIIVDVSEPLLPGDGIALEPPPGADGRTMGFSVHAARTLSSSGSRTRQLVAPATGSTPRESVGWSVVRTSHGALM